MATVTRENIGTLHDKVTVKLAKEDYWPAFEKTLKQYAKTANVPGFRKGMVPAAMVSKMYGQSIFSDEVMRTAARQLEDYLQKEKVEIFAQPMVMPNEQPVKLDMHKPEEVDFYFEMGLKPEFEIAALKNKAHLTRYKVAVTDKMVDDEVERITRRYGKVEDQQTITTKDDVVYTTYEECNETGEIATGAKKLEDTELFDKLPAKLQEMLMGKQAGETIVFRPADVATAEELPVFLKDLLKQGHADAYYKLTITKVGLLIPHELNDVLYTQVFANVEVKDEADFKEKIRQELGREYERVTRDRLQNEIFELLVHSTELQLPVTFLKRWLKEGGEKLKTDQEVENEFSGFDHQLRWTLVSDKLIIDNGISVSREEVMNDIKARVLAYFGMEADDDAPWLDSYMTKITKEEKTMDETYRRLLYGRLFEFLETQFDVEEKEVTEEEFFKQQEAGHHHHH